jgi:hypothetical protein
MMEDVLTKPMSGEKFYNQLSSLFEQQRCIEQNSMVAKARLGKTQEESG